MTECAWVRPTARVLVLDPAGRVLLLGARLTDPAVPPAALEGPVWFRRHVGPNA